MKTILISDAWNDYEIAHEFDAKENVIKECLLRIYEKLGVPPRGELQFCVLSHLHGCRMPSETTAKFIRGSPRTS